MKSGREKQVLIVEDNAADARFVEESLYEGSEKSMAAYQVKVTWVKKLSEAVKKLEENPLYDVILLDLSLPDSSGLEGLLKLKPLSKGIPIIVLTSCSDEELAIQAIDFGAQDYLVKGTFDPYQLVTRSVSYALARQRVTAELEFSNRRLKAINSDLEQFVYVVSHDLQEPLRMVRSFLQMLEKRYSDKLPEEAHEFVNFSVDGAVRMQEMLEHLLEYSRVETKGQDFEKVSLKEILERILKILSTEIEKNQVKIIDEVEDLQIFADGKQLGRVLKSLIENAIRFHSPERPLQIHLSSKVEKNFIILSVEDNGIGIEESNFERIFGIFQRLHAKEDYPGTGIGLAISKRIAQRHGGDLWLESTPGKGSKFYVSLFQKEEEG